MSMQLMIKNLNEDLLPNLPEVMDVNAANDKEFERGFVTEETHYNLTENITKRHRNAISGANGQSIDKTVSCNDNLIHHPETENTSVTAKGGAVPLRAELSTGATDPHEQETIPKEVLDFIKKKQFNKIVVKYILCKLKEKLQNDGKKDVDVVERTVQDVAISMIFYSDSQLDELDHDNSKMKFLCFLLTGESQTLAAHCRLLTNIGCKKLNNIFLLDSDINEYYELTGDILNALGHLLEPKWDSTVRVHILNLQHQTYGQSLCVPYAYGWAVEILEGHILSLSKIKFDESLMVEDLIENLNSKFQHKRFRQLKLTGIEFESDPEFVKKVVSFKVLISLTDPLPQRWELRCGLYLDNIYFFNGSTHERTHKDPRHHTSENTQLPPGDLQSQDSEMYWSIHAFQHQTQRLEPSAPPLEEFLKEVQENKITAYEKDLEASSSMIVTDTLSKIVTDMRKPEAYRDILSNKSDKEDLHKPTQSTAVTNAGSASSLDRIQTSAAKPESFGIDSNVVFSCSKLFQECNDEVPHFSMPSLSRPK